VGFRPQCPPRRRGCALQLHSAADLRAAASAADLRRYIYIIILYVNIYIYIYIQFAARRAATVPFSTGLLASKLQVFFLSGTVRCVHFTSILESLRVILVALGSILVAFGAPGQGSGPLRGVLGAGVQFGAISGKKYYILLESLLAAKISKVAKKHKNTVSRKQSRKSVGPEPPRNGNKLSLYTNNHMF